MVVGTLWSRSANLVNPHANIGSPLKFMVALRLLGMWGGIATNWSSSEFSSLNTGIP